ncbi:MAG: glycoside hydrolase family 43 protein [Clostridia bacterium]|nr:glycoside hydrolase family 43 protein [Clostridia bacterium]
MAYIFAFFTEERNNGEQIYFSVSEDGLHWRDVNGGRPVLESPLGEKGARDPFLVQHPLTGRYYLIATDLCVYNRNHDWYGAVHSGSRDILVWESDDLISWSHPRAVTLAPEGAGCAWAPEAVWDEERQEFLVIFASWMPEGDRHRIYACRTQDFAAFTSAEKYIERERAVIDTTVIRANGRYYRFTKDETTAFIALDRGDTLQGEFTPIPCPLLENLGALEGPECYQLPDGRWCLICDRYKAHTGYLPIVIDDLDAGEMHPLTEREYDLSGVLKRHGGVLKISGEAYERILSHYGMA